MGIDLIARLLLHRHEMVDERMSQAGEDYARLDLGREERTGIPEIVYGAGKTPDQIAEIMNRLFEKLGRALATRVSAETWSELEPLLHGACYNEDAHTVRMGALRAPDARVLVIWGAPAEQAPAAEACETLRFLGLEPVECRAPSSQDVVAAVAGEHKCRLVIALAGDRPGMVSVIAGLIRQPVIAVPVNTGAAGNLDGIAPLLVCLASCAPGIAVVNIDSGFGAAALARKIVLGSDGE